MARSPRVLFAIAACCAACRGDAQPDAQAGPGAGGPGEGVVRDARGEFEARARARATKLEIALGALQDRAIELPEQEREAFRTAVAQADGRRREVSDRSKRRHARAA